MTFTYRALLAAGTVTALLVSGCTRDVAGTAVTASAGEDACATVDAPLADIPTTDASEPQLRIPVPSGWERNSMMDSRVIRYAIVAENLRTRGFATNAVVTLESARGTNETPTQIFDQNRNNLVEIMGASDLSVEANTTCGFPSETTRYTAPKMGLAPERPVIMHAVVAEADPTWLATLTIQTTEPDDPQFRRDAQQIVDGFQLVLPAT